MKVIKKKFFELICVAALVFTSCASIPEPSQKNVAMFYGYAEIVPDDYFYGQKSQKNGITVVLENYKTGKTYTMTSNYRGELIKSNVEPGMYFVKKVSADFFENERSWKIEFSFSSSDMDSLIDIGYGACSLGKFIITSNAQTRMCHLSFGAEKEDVKELFMNYYPDSMWLYESWQ